MLYQPGPGRPRGHRCRSRGAARHQYASQARTAGLPSGPGRLLPPGRSAGWLDANRADPQGRAAPWASRLPGHGKRPTGVFTRQVFPGDTMEADNISADYNAGVLTSTLPVHEQVAAS